jgi:polyisoprenoid-binding protein YceI
MKNKIQQFVFALTLIFSTGILYGQQKTLDVTASKIKWTGKEITTKTHYGSLLFKSGKLSIKDGLLVDGEFIVDMTTINCEDLSGDSKGYLENHLRSDDFFGVAQHPEASLKIESAEINKDGGQTVSGQLTIKGITENVTFQLQMNNNQATASLIFDRSKHNIKFRSDSFFDDLGDKLIYDDIVLEVNLMF